jgi:hypothetical protein
MTGNPSRLVRFWFTKAYTSQKVTKMIRDKTTYIGVVVLRQDIQELLVERRLDSVEFAYIGMLHPIHNNFAAQN